MIMIRLPFSRASIFLICFCGLLPGVIPPSVVDAAERQINSSSSQSECSAVLLKNQEYFPALIKAIDEAKSEIIMSFFLFKAGVHKNSYPDRVLAHLAKSAQRGVRVLVILENSGDHDRNLDAENRLTKKLLEAKGVEVYFDSPRKTMHNKLIVIDQRLVLLGSHNLTQAALKYNNEISILIDRPELAKEARTYMLTIIKEVK
jgi:phosphatidylserine/phosphatidylglycerophosphate/cardiolipin synthase-like enzyme